MPNTDLLILGAGLTGLAAAHTARRAGLRVAVIDQAAQPGGVLQSRQRQGYTLDFGANSMALTPDLQALIDDLDLHDHLLPAQPAGNQRLLFRRGRLHPVVPKPLALLRSGQLSGSGKLRLLMEPLVPKLQAAREETVAEFFTRRLGQEAFAYLVEPVLTGIYAGDAQRMSVQAVLPQVQQMEQAHGSLFGALRHLQNSRPGGGLPQRKIASFDGGMATLIRALAGPLGEDLHLRSRVLRVHPDPETGGFWTEVEQAGHHQDWRSACVLWTLPAQAAPALDELAPEVSLRIHGIPYPPMLMYALGYRRADLGRPLDSFGFLVPSATQQPLLGAIWNSAIFPGKAPKYEALFTLFVGGMGHMGASETELLAQAEAARAMFERCMGITGAPTFVSHYHWPRAIPQYELGHSELVRQIRALEARWPGFFVSANWLDGVSVGDRAKGGREVVSRMQAMDWRHMTVVGEG